ncbi:sensor histidine kinase [Solimicrobium silvestre]|uniref:histidine kinase n=1 Tax=Solimicrobium silvestre TaxID=2099400 RepID=A0A2S9GU47_9BURK|nr:ATP-binding protein [Solimicrobium silvestre]PRC91233.1 Histidine kinase-, DNA gyrase B-, and HSP90-like ATPase [Solimicrobium silvestre]
MLKKNAFPFYFRLAFFLRGTSLRSAIIAAVFFGLIGSAIILIPYNISSIDTNAHKRQLEDHQRLTNILAVIQSEPLWQITPDIARISSDVVYSDPRIATIDVFSLPDHKKFLTLSRKEQQKGPFSTIVHTIKHDEKVIGIVELTMADDLLIEEERTAFIRYAITAIFSLIIAVILILLVLQQRLVVPIRRLMKESERLSNGELTNPIVFNRSDEIGHLADTMEATRQALARTFSELEIKNNQLTDYSNTLESKVKLRTSELETALKNINHVHQELTRIERMASLGSMVAGVAHELNTPIGNCLLVASTLEAEVLKFTELFTVGNVRRSELDKFMQCANESSTLLLRGLHQAAHLVGDFKQVAVDQSSAQRRQFDLHTMMIELTSLLMPGLSKTPYILIIDIPTNIEMDSFPGPLGQVFTNLITNSVTHGFNERDYGNMRITAELVGHNVKMTFTDDGYGIPPEILHRIYEPFFTTRFGRGGSGLGLSITYNIVTNVLGGEILATSAQNQGCKFVITLPLVTPIMDEANAPSTLNFAI